MTICTPWRVANCLEQLLAQVNAQAPNRNKASDGGIGNAAHQLEACASQHNSCCIKVNGIWIVRARDFTHDPAGGFDSYAFAEQLRLSHDPRIRYIISNRRITSASRGWEWESYAGDDPHTNHAHVSTWDDQARFDDTSHAWRIAPPSDLDTEEPVTVNFPTPFTDAANNTNGSPIFFGTPGQTCTWVGNKGSALPAIDSIRALVSGKWVEEWFASTPPPGPGHTPGAAPGVHRSLIHILGPVPSGYGDCDVNPAPSNTADIVAGVLQGLANDPASEVTQEDVDGILAAIAANPSAVRQEFTSHPLT